jgi:chemotaxis protein MotB
MPRSARFPLLAALGLLACLPTGCSSVPRMQHALRQSQLRALQLHQHNQTLVAERDQAGLLAQSVTAEKQNLEQQLASLQSNLDTANQRLANLNSERSQLQDRYVSLLNQAKNGPSPLSNETTRRLEDLKRKYPDFDFDPQTGVSKFHSDILFASGSTDIKPTALPMLREFAAIMNQGDASRLNILVVGHTDDRPIAKAATKQRHPTNWHLSTNRANSVVMALSGAGVKDGRMGSAGYSMFQPVVPNKDDKARQMNRRVEIFVLAPDAVVAGWEPGITDIH